MTFLTIRLNATQKFGRECSKAKVGTALDMAFDADGINPNDGSCSIYTFPAPSLQVLLEFWEGLVHFHSTPGLAWLQALGQLPVRLHKCELVGHLIKEHFYSPSRMKHKLSISSYTWWTLSNYLWLALQWWSMRKCQTCLSHFSTKVLCFCSLTSSSFTGLAQTIYLLEPSHKS